MSGSASIVWTWPFTSRSIRAMRGISHLKRRSAAGSFCCNCECLYIEKASRRCRHWEQPRCACFRAVGTPWNILSAAPSFKDRTADPVPAAHFLRPGFSFFASLTRKRGGGAPRDVRVLARHPLSLHVTRQARHLARRLASPYGGRSPPGATVANRHRGTPLLAPHSGMPREHAPNEQG